MKSSYSKIKDRIVYPQNLPASDIKAIRAWRKSKLKSVTSTIINNPGILTHELQNQVRVNNVPNAVDYANAKLRELGYELECVPTTLKNKQSYCWYLLALNKKV